MDILILGAGAMGSLFGGRLAEAYPGWNIVLADVWAEHVRAMREKGLNLTDEDGSRSMKVKALLTSEVSERADVIMVFTKAQHTEAALAEIAEAAIDSNTRLVSLQNGLGGRERLAKFVPLERVIIGMTTFTSDFVAPGVIKSSGRGLTKMMSAGGRADDEVMAEFCQALNKAGMSSEIDPLVEVQIWKKVGFNSAFNSLCAITRLDCGALGSTEAGRKLLFGLARECAEVAAAHGLELKADDIISLLEDSLVRHARHLPSMLQDIQAGRPTEIDSLNGAIIRLGKEKGVPTPINEMAYDLVMAITTAVVSPS